MIDPDTWPVIAVPPLDPEVEARIDDLLSRMTLEQKVGQVIQGDTASLSPEDVKTYRLGSILSGGNSAPGGKAFAEAHEWLADADAYHEASLDSEGVEVAIPVIWGIDAVHGHTNVVGATVFPHNVGLGAANDPDLVRRVSAATAVELNVTGHDWTFAPTLAVPQNDCWGRTYEGFSETPDITKAYGGEVVTGLQGELGTDAFLVPGRVISTAKHFLGDGGTEGGSDQGDARISESELRDIHLPGYETALAAGALSVMASFSSWQGERLHGHKALLTDVLKDRIGFTGFVVGDWNGHALIPDCTATDCPQALLAGLDMYMAPDSWKGLWESTLAHVKSGRIPMARLEDANRRILRAKIAAGVFAKPKPSARPLAGEVERLGSPAHRELAREAVRKSLVLLKNEGALPLDASGHVHVVGAGADSIAKLCGGWTLSWQGRGHSNSLFPNGETLLDAIRRVVGEAGGTVTFDAVGDDVPDGADVVVAVYGEDPYAEYRGDLENVKFTSPDFDTGKLAGYRGAGLGVVSLFVSGRPLWVNPELNASDAFVALWLPGSEPAGVADLLFRTDESFDFTGRLSFSWPKLASQVELNPHSEGFDPLFPLGYGLSYESRNALGTLSEESGVSESGVRKDVFFSRGATPGQWRLTVDSKTVGVPGAINGVSVRAFDRAAQEDSLRVAFARPATFAITSSYPLDYAEEAEAGMELCFWVRSLNGEGVLVVGAGSEEHGERANLHDVAVSDDWREVRIPLARAVENGVDMTVLKHAFLLRGRAGQDVAVSEVGLRAGGA